MEGTRDSAVTRSTGLDEDLMKWADDERAPLVARIDERSSENDSWHRSQPIVVAYSWFHLFESIDARHL